MIVWQFLVLGVVFELVGTVFDLSWQAVAGLALWCVAEAGFDACMMLWLQASPALRAMWMGCDAPGMHLSREAYRQGW